VAHDSHNIAAVRVADEEMRAAVLAVKQMGCGLVDVAGLLSERCMRDVALLSALMPLTRWDASWRARS
jgi:adenine deaminase